MLTRTDLQQLAEEKIGDAEILLRANRFAGSYYLSGLAVECAIKACIAKRTNLHDFPDKQRADSSWHHNLGKLIETAEIKNDHDLKVSQSKEFFLNWNTVIQWKNESRFDVAIDQAQAESMFLGVTQPVDGVLPWLRTLW